MTTGALKPSPLPDQVDTDRQVRKEMLLESSNWTGLGTRMAPLLGGSLTLMSQAVAQRRWVGRDDARMRQDLMPLGARIAVTEQRTAQNSANRRTLEANDRRTLASTLSLCAPSALSFTAAYRTTSVATSLRAVILCPRAWYCFTICPACGPTVFCDRLNFSSLKISLLVILLHPPSI